jgi:hypothetical protein
MTLRKIAKSIGWTIRDEYVRFTGWGLRMSRAKLISLNPKFASMPDSELSASHKPFDVLSWVQKRSGI